MTNQKAATIIEKIVSDSEFACGGVPQCETELYANYGITRSQFNQIHATLYKLMLRIEKMGH
jgi:hypothetical protein